MKSNPHPIFPIILGVVIGYMAPYLLSLLFSINSHPSTLNNNNCYSESEVVHAIDLTMDKTIESIQEKYILTPKDK